MSVSWHGCSSVPRSINGGGPAGGTLGILEYLAQSNDNADCVSTEDRFKFMDDLSILEIVNLLTIGLSSFNVKSQVPSDILENNKYIPPQNLKSQNFLNQIDSWTQKKKMKINSKKSKTMIFNFSRNHQFSTRLELSGEVLEIVNHTKLLGTVISDDLKWGRNTQNIVQKANKRMEILRKISNFGASYDDLKTIYIAYIRSILEQSCTVWNSGLTEENVKDIERVQKSALRLILAEKYQNYKNALNILELESLEDRRRVLCLEFAKKCLKNEKIKSLLFENEKLHDMKTRKSEKFFVNHANTSRLMNSPIVYMQILLNEQ